MLKNRVPETASFMICGLSFNRNLIHYGDLLAGKTADADPCSRRDGVDALTRRGDDVALPVVNY